MQRLLDLSALDNTSQAASSTLEEVILNEEREELASQFRSLESREREALQAFYEIHPDMRTVSQLARDWGVSRQRVYQVCAAARRRLRCKLAKFLEEHN